MGGETGNHSNDILSLRAVTQTDLPIFYEQQLDPDAAHMAAFPSRNREDFMAHWAKIMQDATAMMQTILFDGLVAGNIVSFEMEGAREVGYWLGKNFWGKGIATRTLAAFLNRDKTRPLYAHVAQHNLGSLRVLQKCGFMVIGTDQGMRDAASSSVDEFILKLTDE